MRRRLISLVKAGSSNKFRAMKIRTSELKETTIVKLSGVNSHKLIRTVTS